MSCIRSPRSFNISTLGLGLDSKASMMESLVAALRESNKKTSMQVQKSPPIKVRSERVGVKQPEKNYPGKLRKRRRPGIEEPPKTEKTEKRVTRQRRTRTGKFLSEKEKMYLEQEASIPQLLTQEEIQRERSRKVQPWKDILVWDSRRAEQCDWHTFVDISSRYIEMCLKNSGARSHDKTQLRYAVSKEKILEVLVESQYDAACAFRSIAGNWMRVVGQVDMTYDHKGETDEEGKEGRCFICKKEGTLVLCDRRSCTSFIRTA
eukprot:TRINITY_DN10461_c0_g1_i1.p1 TRINITY_DN10461_c0_g1~~TRINITY_DN10461_c0_g1_i1.p1  ORF type:complete len:263 (+),score=27.22 TRINITY_DN10461_c0_g1_i1:102-890(+)